MKLAQAFSLLFVPMFLASFALAEEDYPPTPDGRLTPGSICADADEHRYPEEVPYCRRGVDGERKIGVFNSYIEVGYKIDMRRRSDYKIDHLIPLCAGGSNEVDNLWPEFISLYTLLDPIEPAICGKMALGRLRQKHAIEIVLRAKHNPDEAGKWIDYVNAL